mmetsp:Transcript_12207/g.44534  ORF Transcript_12207/g.44534 Transcript_12207/m.44534 type:complete len:96 (+) Transcript_12207:416-703(+)
MICTEHRQHRDINQRAHNITTSLERPGSVRAWAPTMMKKSTMLMMLDAVGSMSHSQASQFIFSVATLGSTEVQQPELGQIAAYSGPHSSFHRSIC